VTAPLLVLLGALALGGIVWLIGRVSKPAAMSAMSEAWVHEHKYDREH
jgi:hypothetical protein